MTTSKRTSTTTDATDPSSQPFIRWRSPPRRIPVCERKRHTLSYHPIWWRRHSCLRRKRCPHSSHPRPHSGPHLSYRRSITIKLKARPLGYGTTSSREQSGRRPAHQSICKVPATRNLPALPTAGLLTSKVSALHPSHLASCLPAVNREKGQGVAAMGDAGVAQVTPRRAERPQRRDLKRVLVDTLHIHPLLRYPDTPPPLYVARENAVILVV